MDKTNAMRMLDKAGISYEALGYPSNGEALDAVPSLDDDTIIWLDIVDMMVGLQRTFGISLRQNEELRQIVTLGDLHAFFLKLVKENPDLAAKLQKK